MTTRKVSNQVEEVLSRMGKPITSLMIMEVTLKGQRSHLMETRAVRVLLL
jgi:hypothetical protein